MPLTPEQTAKLSQADLELRYLLTVKAVPGPTLNDARFQAYGENEHTYFSALSGLTPTYRYSLADHKLAYYRAQTATTSLTLADTERLFWASQVP